MYDLAPLKLQTEEVATEALTKDNMVDMYALSDLHNADNLKEASKLFIKKNREELKKKDLTEYPHSVMNNLVRILI